MVISTMIITSARPSSDHHLGDPRDPCSDLHLIILVVINVQKKMFGWDWSKRECILKQQIGAGTTMHCNTTLQGTAVAVCKAVSCESGYWKFEK